MMEAHTLTSWLSRQAKAEVVAATSALATAATEIAAAIYNAPVAGQIGTDGHMNVQGEIQQNLDLICNDIMMQRLREVPHIALMVSEEIDEVVQNDAAVSDANLAVCFDPLDGSSNIESNGTIGSIFSILALDDMKPTTAETVLASTKHQLVAGYFLYGPSSLLVLTAGNSVAMFALNGSEYVLVRDNISIPEETNEFAINMAYRRFWNTETTQYIDDCLRGKEGSRAKNFNMRWMGAMVADIHRIFMRGGIFIYPALNTSTGGQGKLRALYEVNPMAFLIECAGGAAMSGDVPSLELQPNHIHQRAPFAAGSKAEVAHYMSARNTNETTKTAGELV